MAMCASPPSQVQTTLPLQLVPQGCGSAHNATRARIVTSTNTLRLQWGVVMLFGCNGHIIAISCADIQETELASVGFVSMLDPESNESVLPDARSRNKLKVKDALHGRLHLPKKLFKHYKVDFVHLQSNQHFIHNFISHNK